MNEVWAVIPRFPSYAVSTHGRIKRIKSGRILRQSPWKSYRKVQFSEQGLVRNAFVHRIVAEVFVLNPEKLPEVNHIKGFSNHADNLEWRTDAGNRQHRTLHKLAGDGIH